MGKIGITEQAGRLYYSERCNLYCFWPKGMQMLFVGPSPNEPERFTVKFYSDNAIAIYLEEEGYKKVKPNEC